MSMISFGENIPKLVITAAIIGTFIFVIVHSFDCMDDFKTSVDDMGEEEHATQVGQKFLKGPWGIFKTLIFIILGAVGLCQLIDMWA